jgi:hypothetical protein
VIYIHILIPAGAGIPAYARYGSKDDIEHLSLPCHAIA